MDKVNYLSAKKVLVDRKQIVKNLMNEISKDHRIIFIHGKGGIGKTV